MRRTVISAALAFATVGGVAVSLPAANAVPPTPEVDVCVHWAHQGPLGGRTGRICIPY